MLSKIINPKVEIKWQCYDTFITIDNHVFDLSFEPKIERMVGGSYGYTINGVFRSKKWIRENCINVLGHIDF